MSCNADEYHPYAACLMYKACKNATLVRANLQGVIDRGRQPRLSVLRECALYLECNDPLAPPLKRARELLKDK